MICSSLTTRAKSNPCPQELTAWKTDRKVQPWIIQRRKSNCSPFISVIINTQLLSFGISDIFRRNGVGERDGVLPTGILEPLLLKSVGILLIRFHNDLHFSSAATTAQPENLLLCSVQAEGEHLHIAWSSSSPTFHISPKIFLTTVLVHHCQHFLPYFNSDSSLNATIKHTCPRNTFPTRLTYGSVFPSLSCPLFSSASRTKPVLSRPSAILVFIPQLLVQEYAALLSLPPAPKEKPFFSFLD